MSLKKKLSTITIMKQKVVKEKITNHQKAAKTRRQRGYQWEDTIVKRFKKSEIGKHLDWDLQALHYQMY